MTEIVNQIKKPEGVIVYDQIYSLCNDYMGYIKSILSDDVKKKIKEQDWYYNKFDQINFTFIDLHTVFESDKTSILNNQHIQIVKETLQNNKHFLDFYFQPIAVVDNFDSLHTQIAKLFYNLVYYGKKNANTFDDIKQVYSEELKIYCLYAVQDAVAELCDYKSLDNYKAVNFPSIIELKKAIHYKNQCALQLYANVNWLLEK
jgi:hypothetical protein